ncbi:MAG: lipid-A-disaccharide synthase [Bacteroidetes bacterium]|nr:lipid-A-disaccharide synthase [Bacteroidota bacterium]
MILAGEASGDRHGADLVRELKALNPQLTFFGMGGDRMKAEGVELFFHISQTSIMGFTEVIRHLPFIFQMKKTLEQAVADRRPVYAVLIDYPGFNLRFARFLHQNNVPVIWYIAPQVWAWGKGRLKDIRRYVDLMLCILPFEEPFFRKAGIRAHFVGHPLVEQIEVSGSSSAFLSSISLPDDRPLIGLLPGSRSQEVSALLPVMVNAVLPLIQQGRVSAAVAGVNHLPPDVYKPAGEAGIPVVFGKVHDLMGHSTLSVVASGTATLETALCGTPLIVVYKTSWLTYLIGRFILRLDRISLVNIIPDEQLVPELIQHEANPESIRKQILSWLDQPAGREMVIEKLARLRKQLGSLSASREAASRIQGRVSGNGSWE